MTAPPSGEANAPATAPAHAPTALGLALALAPGTLFAGIAGGIAFPILPVVGQRFGLSLPFIGVILAANRAVRVASSPFIGVLADKFGGRRTLLAGLAVLVVVLVFYALGIATHRVGPFFLAGRLLHGLGSGCVFIAAQALALHAGGPAHGGRAAGTVRAAIILGVPIGLVAGGLLSDAVGEKDTFWIASSAAVVSFAGAYASVPDLRVTIRRRPPMLETLRALSERRLLALGALNAVLAFAISGMILTTLALLVQERHVSVMSRNAQGTAGLMMAWMILIDAAATPFAGRLGDRWRAHARVATGAMLLTVVGLVVVGLSSRATGLLAGLTLLGLGGAGLGPSLLVLMGAIVPRERQGTGIGLMQLCGDVGGMLGPLVGTALFSGDTKVPYLGTAVLVACFVPLAMWLSRMERGA